MTWNPYDELPSLPGFTLASNDIQEGKKLELPQVSGIFGAGGEDVSPHLSWSGFPSSTEGFAVTMFDPDAPSGSGFWHWGVADIPPEVTVLPTGAGDDAGEGLPAEAFQIPNDARLNRFLGASPPAGSEPHRYIFAVHALDVRSLGIGNDVSSAFFGFNVIAHAVARATLTTWYQR
jgi:Raf kinase inhibitor-like YbhB/YbcL family protein